MERSIECLGGWIAALAIMLIQDVNLPAMLLLLHYNIEVLIFFLVY